MHVQELSLKNFKRFTDLSIKRIPENTKLVLLIGANGSGKSSVFDAFETMSRSLRKSDLLYSSEERQSYYRKDQTFSTSVTINYWKDQIVIDNDISNQIYYTDGIQAPLSEENRSELAQKFIGRSSIRIVPQITVSANPQTILTDADGPGSYIQNDTRFVNDVFVYIQQINQALREPVFRGKQVDVLQIFKDFIEPLNTSLLNILGGTEQTTIQVAEFQDATPNIAAKLIFRKGESKINYDLLSHGEKQVVILLLNFIVRREYYKDVIIFIDEMDCHLNTAIQFSLLKEITARWIPNNSQLWTASHALGFIDYAHQNEESVIIDFDNLDFDLPQILYPEPKSNLDVYEIAVPKSILFELMQGKKIVLCENKNDEYYNLLLLPDTIFVGVKDARDLFLHVKRDNRYITLRDRDFLSDAEITRIQSKYPNHRILDYYDFENYLYHPDNISELVVDFEKEDYIKDISSQKDEKIDYFILPSIISSRQSYEEFKTEPSIRDKDVTQIVSDLKSNEFERFYKYFDMKVQYNGGFLRSYNLSKEKLVNTRWFKSKIDQLLTIS
ncbi:AAA family ATPase [Dyadobacter frigoris]|uniref:Chromosome segregation protein SMC n=1 Tax=Dyadobacter frigoris TaxID=2576211 RepID=A0A4U6CYX6_9BACT|nr:AAA family ATPase [Dyadobacter frigoris]TKT86634.1 chromosome segregation protein SMC [Dyadobacter frigoris]GLU56816.1 hypothetical protein Dfri01_62770 [Dyadobacter frigoris]